jgi:hypothetical protein
MPLFVDWVLLPASNPYLLHCCCADGVLHFSIAFRIAGGQTISL